MRFKKGDIVEVVSNPHRAPFHTGALVRIVNIHNNWDDPNKDHYSVVALNQVDVWWFLDSELEYPEIVADTLAQQIPNSVKNHIRQILTQHGN